MDDLGNRTEVDLRDGSDETYVVDDDTNRYTSIGGNNLTYDDAGNLTTDKDGYKYSYDYENHIIEIKDSSNNDVAEFAYDALGRRIRKIDSKASETTYYYYNDNWQVFAEFDADDSSLERSYIGVYPDENRGRCLASFRPEASQAKVEESVQKSREADQPNSKSSIVNSKL